MIKDNQGIGPKPHFKEALRFWLKLGFISFGGPAGQIAIMHEFLVDKKKWISDSRFLHALNYCMLLPGPEAQQLATYVGWLLHGTLGGLTAGILFVLPSVFILLGLSILYVTYGTIPWVYALFYGLKPAVVAIVLLALLKIGKKALQSPLHYGVALVSFLSLFLLDIPFPYIILSTILLAGVVRQYFPALLPVSSPEKADPADGNESLFYLNSQSVMVEKGFTGKRFIRQLLTGILLWLAPFLLFHHFSRDFAFWKNLSLFFTQAALVTFGGAYAVLPYVAQVTVEKFGWLSGSQMIDGLALGESTPGPLIMVLAFVGFMAGFNHFENSITAGTVGLLTTTYFTFLPCFLFILIGAPVVEKTRQHQGIKTVLSLVTAAVTGVMLNLTVYFGQAVTFPKGFSIHLLDWFSLGWIILSVAALYRFKVSLLPWIGISALAGFVYYLIR